MALSLAGLLLAAWPSRRAATLAAAPAGIPH
jgi:hypothetical protein